jgi:hypothetical protein
MGIPIYYTAKREQPLTQVEKLCGAAPGPRKES